MSDTTTLATDQVEALAVKLDGLAGLDGDDKALLASVFAVAGLAAGSASDAASSGDEGPGDDVSGFAMVSYRPGNNRLLPAVQFGIVPGGLQGSFTRGFEYGGAPPDPC